MDEWVNGWVGARHSHIHSGIYINEVMNGWMI